MTQERLNRLIIDQDYDNLFTQLRQLQSHDSDWQTQLIAIEGQYRALVKERQQGIIRPEESIVRENIVRKNLADLVQEASRLSLITTAGTDNSIPPTQLSLPSRSRKSLTGVLLAAIFLILACAIYFFIVQTKQEDSISNKTTPIKDSMPDTVVSPQPSNTAVAPNNSTIIQKPATKPAVALPNILQVTATPNEYKALLAAKASELLRDAKITHQHGNSTNYDNRIECAFDLQKSKTQSGMREAFRYALHLLVNIYSKDGTLCFSGSYSSSTSRIGYPEDSEDDVQRKIIEPGLEEIKTSLERRPPTLCKK